MIFETHAHYDDEAFDKDRDILLSSMQDNKIGFIVNVGASLKSTAASIQLAKQYPFVYAAAGVHPNETAELNEETYAWLREQSGLITIGMSRYARFRKYGLRDSLNLQGISENQLLSIPEMPQRIHMISWQRIMPVRSAAWFIVFLTAQRWHSNM